MMINHLWQSTVFAASIALACLLLRHHSPRLRYWLWLAASLKFLIPFSLLIDAGARLQPAPDAVHQPVLTATRVEQIATVMTPLPPSSTGNFLWFWLAGALAVAGVRARQWWTLARIRRQARPVALDGFPVPVYATDAAVEPGIFGVARPVFLIPDGLDRQLDRAQLDSILAHELCHVRHRDNLTAALHMITEALFWFHPLVWWIGARLIRERERHCDESVLAQGNRAEAYAQGIVNVCRLYAPTPLPCAAGVTGADLKQRIRAIMTARLSAPLSKQGQAALAAFAAAAVLTPFAIGVLKAQTTPPPPQHGYEVATVRPSNAGDNNSRIGPGPQGGLRATNVTAMTLVTFAYDLRPHHITGAPGWASSDRWDVSFTPDKPEVMPQSPKDFPGREKMESMFNRQRQRMQAVLRDRFGLVLRIEQKEQPYFGLVQVKGGHKLKPGDQNGAPNMQIGPGRVRGNNVYFNMIANSLSGFMQRHVVNETGLDGPFNFELTYTHGSDRGEPTEADRAAVIAAMPEQLGLKIESRKGPVPVYVVEKITKPDAN